MLLLLLFSCQNFSSSKSGSNLAKGDCLDKALSPYVLQVAAVEGQTVYYYHMQEMGKKIHQKSIADLMSGEGAYQKLACP